MTLENLNALQKFGLILMNTADPTTIPRFEQQQIMMDELTRKKQQRQALMDYAASANVPQNMRGLFQAAPELLPEYMMKQNDPLTQLQMEKARFDLQTSRTTADQEKARRDMIAGFLGGNAAPQQMSGAIVPERNFTPIPQQQPQAPALTQQQQLLGRLAMLDESMTDEFVKSLTTPSAEPFIKNEGDLRKEFEGLNKDFREVQRAYTRIQKSVEAPSAAGDLSLIFNYMKMLDPGSTVREGEFATTQNSAGVPDMIRARYNQVMKGERLTDNQRTDFSNRSTMLFQGAVENYNGVAGRYRNLATQYGLSPGRVAEEVEAPKISPTPGKIKFLGFEDANR